MPIAEELALPWPLHDYTSSGRRALHTAPKNIQRIKATSQSMYLEYSLSQRIENSAARWHEHVYLI
jgi:hypothetical protein